MRLIVFFDLPVVKRSDRKIAAQFRKFLINDGYTMVQFSVYSRICNGNHAVDKHMIRLQKEIPSKGSVRSMVVTEKQYAAMELHVGEHTTEEKVLNSKKIIIL